MPPYLSQELVDIIIDHLHDDHDTLRACALTCRSWAPTSQLHLFVSVKLDSAAKSARLLLVTSQAPVIASYVRDLDLVESRSSRLHADEPSDRRKLWLDDPLVGLEALRSVLQHVRILCIDGVIWHTLSPRSLTALREGSSNVRHVTLLNITFATPAVLRDALGSFKALDSLNLASMMLQSSTVEGDDGSELTRIAVRRLRYIPGATFPTAVLLRVLDMSALEDLTTVCKNDDTAFYANEICCGAGSSLKSLTIHCGFDDNGMSIRALLYPPYLTLVLVRAPTLAKLSLSAANCLRSLKIDFININSEPANAFYWLAELADSTPSPFLATLKYNAMVTDATHAEALDWARISTLHERRSSVELVTLVLLPIYPCDEHAVFDAMAARFSATEGKFRVKVLLVKREGR